MIYLDAEQSEPLYQQLYRRISHAILTGEFPAGTRLPASRGLAADLKVSRNTVNRVYQQLLAEGYLTSRVGSGFYVNQLDPELLPQPVSAPAPEAAQAVRYRCHFFYGCISSKVFPSAAWRNSLNAAMARLECSEFIEYPERQGEEALRQSVANYLRASRGVECAPEQVVITGGHQHSMEILAGLFEAGGRRLALEEPGYDGIRVVFENHGYRILPIPVEGDGVQVEAVEGSGADLLYLTPAHQFPTGCFLSIPKRLSLLAWAGARGAYLIEDDYDSELRYSFPPVPSMQSLAPRQVIYTGTFSKCIAPFIRTAYLVLPPQLLPRYRQIFWRYNTQVSPILQYALADFIDSGAFQRHISRLRTYYRRQQADFLQALTEIFGPRIAVCGAGAGLHVLVDFRLEAGAEQLIASAARAGIGVYSPIANYVYPERCPPSMLLLGFATWSAQTNAKALRAMKDQWIKDGLYPPDRD